MEAVEDRFQVFNAIYTNLSTAFEKQLIEKEEKELQKAKDAMEDRLKEQDHIDQLETNRTARKERLLQAEMEVICERAAAEALARADPPAQPAVLPAGPVGAALPHHGPAAAPQRCYREVQTLHPGSLCLENSPEELRIF